MVCDRFITPWLAAALFALAASGCQRPSEAAPASVAVGARARPAPPSLAPSAASVRGRLKFALVGSWLWLDGHYVAPFKHIDYVGLFARLRQRRAEARGSDVTTFELEVDDTADSRITQNILSLTADAGFERVELITKAARVGLCLEECRDGAEADRSKALRTAVMLRRGGIEVWSGRELPLDPSGVAEPEVEKLLEASWATADDELEAGLQRVCSEHARCSRVAVYFDAELPGRGLLRVLESFDRAVRAAGATPPGIELSLLMPPASGEEAYAFVRVRDAAGRLPPVVIRQVVRASYGTFRECYLRGLVTNPKLTGRVTVRFEILPDGSVSGVADGGGDLPNDVTSCVLQGFTRIRFPAPRDGAVTVQYPILMVPPG